MSSRYMRSCFSSVRSAGHAPLYALLALLLVAGVVPASAQQHIDIFAPRRAPRVETRDSTSSQLKRFQRQLDSLARAYSDDDQLTIAERRQVEEELRRTMDRLEELSARMTVEPGLAMLRAGERVRRLRGPLAAVQGAAADAMSRALMQMREAGHANPRGWIGFLAQGPGLEPWIEDGQLIVRYLSYPRILSVDPNSPAQRAGVIPNDTLIAYDGRDVRDTDISLTTLLRPNARVIVRVRRDGRVLNIPVTVATAPTRIVQRRGEEVREREPWLPVGPAFPPVPLRTPTAPGSMMRGPKRMPSSAPLPPLVPTPAAPPARAMGAFVLMGNGVAGAQLTTLTEGLAQAIGVSSGVLVTSAPVGLPAYESGLRDGDVIAKVGGQAVRSVTEVRELVGLVTENGERAVEVEIVRQKKTQKLKLRW